MAKATKCLAAAILLASAARAEFPAERFIQAKQGGKWGLLDQKGHTILPFAYDFLSVDDHGDIIVTANEMSGKADANGNLFIPVSYSSLSNFHDDGYAEASLNGRSGLIDRKNQWVLPAIFSGVTHFDKGDLYAARYKGAWGVLSLSQKHWVIQPSFFYIGPLAKNGLAPAKTDLKHVGFIRSDGSWAIPAGKFEDLWEFADDGLAPAKQDGKWGFINSQGDWLIRPISDDIIWPNAFNKKGTTFIKIDGKYRLINRSGKFVTPQAYDEMHFFKDGAAQVRIDRKWATIDEDGKLLSTPTVLASTAFHSEGLAAVIDGKTSYIIDRTGKRRFGSKFERVGGFFGGGWAAAASGGKWGAIDVHGNWLLSPKYDCVSICFDDPPPVIRIRAASSD